MPLKKRQKEILKDEYRNGEWYAKDIKEVKGIDLPRADCWCFGAPCQSFSVAGKRAGLDGESGLIREIFRLLDELEEKDKPEWIIYENVKGMFSSNRGWDYAAILAEMDRLGYDIEWQNINSKWFVPQNRERIYTIGHLRRFGRNTQVFSQNAITEALDIGQGGGRGHHVGLPCFIDMNKGAGIKNTDNARALQARYNKGINNHSGEISGVAIPVLTPDRAEKRQNGRRFKDNGEPMFTLTSQDKHGVGIEVLDGVYTNPSPDYNRGILDGASRTLKADSHPAGVALGLIDSQGRNNKEVSLKEVCPTLRSEAHGNVPNVCVNVNETPNYGDGIFVEMPEGFIVYAIWYEKYQCYIAIRKLTPKECFRLQGWTDDYFERAAFVNSDSQLYKQAGNGVTVNVIKALGDELKRNNKE